MDEVMSQASFDDGMTDAMAEILAGDTGDPASGHRGGLFVGEGHDIDLPIV
jgi:hypothetical protein